MLSQCYPYWFAREIVQKLRAKHTRATDFLFSYYPVTEEYLIKIFQEDQKRWEKVRHFVKLLEFAIECPTYVKYSPADIKRLLKNTARNSKRQLDILKKGGKI